jgi:fused signal recognition particle receptor
MEQEKNLFARMRKGLFKSREFLTHQMEGLFTKRARIDSEFFDELEEILILADLGIKATSEILENLKEMMKERSVNSREELLSALKEVLHGILKAGEGEMMVCTTPFVILVIGVNGVGKTTTIGKMAELFKKQGKKVLLAAGDTFRAAAVEQLGVWGKRAGVECITHQMGGDAAAVIYDAVSACKSRGYDVLIADTAGRLHTKVNLVEELKKIKRVMDKGLPGAPHETLLVLDATTGQNALSQARMFDEALGISGLVLTKLDGTAKGGILVSITSELKKPVRYIGIGEGRDDLKVFRAEEFAVSLIGEDSLRT